MGQEFLTWTDLGTYAIFITITFLCVEFTKELKFIKNIPTTYWSAFVSFILLNLVHAHAGTWEAWDLVLYALNAILISLGANGASTINTRGK